MVKKIGILASGGDAPGMNCAMIGAIRAGYKLNKKMYVIKHGYYGLVQKVLVYQNLKIQKFKNKVLKILKNME